MIHKPPIDELANTIGSKYELCVVASKRARQLIEQFQNKLIVYTNKFAVVNFLCSNWQRFFVIG